MVIKWDARRLDNGSCDEYSSQFAHGASRVIRTKVVLAIPVELLAEPKP